MSYNLFLLPKPLLVSYSPKYKPLYEAIPTTLVKYPAYKPFLPA